MKTFVSLFVFAIFFINATGTSQYIDVLHYRASIDFDMEREEITGTALVTLRNVSRGDISNVPLHLYNLSVERITLDNDELTYNHTDTDLDVKLSAPLPPNDTIQLSITYSGNAVAEPGPVQWGGCFWNTNETSFSMGVGFFAPWVSTLRHWLPSNDIPSDKATFDITFTVPDSFVVASAGLLQSIDFLNGKASYRWVENHQTATYLFNYAISDYVLFSDSWNGIPLEFYVKREDSLKGSTFFNTVPDMLEAFSQRFGPYPFSKVGYCVTPIGAMEHQTMINYGQATFDQYSQAGNTAAHELAHQWWGDWVTPVDFRNAWLSEGFAVFSEAVYQEYLGGREGYVNHVYDMGRNYKSSVAPVEGLFPLYDFPREMPSSNYPQTIYKKGGAVLAMLREVLGEETFFEALREYGTTYAYANASTADFQAIMEQHYGSSLDWFFDTWVYDRGYPTYSFTVLKDEGRPLRLQVEQKQDQGTIPLFKMPIPLFVVTRSLDTLHFTVVNEAVESQVFEFPSISSDSALIVRIDPERLILSRQSTKTVGIEPLSNITGFQLNPIYPNPIPRGSQAFIPVEIEKVLNIKISLFDTLGRYMTTVSEGMLDPAVKHIPFDTGTIPIGTYILHASTGNKTLIQRLEIQ